MKKLEFFLNAINAGRLKEKSWINSAFSVTINNKKEIKPWDIKYVVSTTNEVTISFYDDACNLIDIDDFSYDKLKPMPPYTFAESIELKKGDIENVFRDIKTRYGNLVANWLWLVYPFGSKIEFILGKFGIEDLEAILEPLITTTPDNDADRKPNLIYVDEYSNKFTKVKDIIDGMSQLSVPSATKKSLGHHPDRNKVRKELLEKYKGRERDPEVAAAIDKAMVDLDKEWLAGDRSMGFYIQGKMLNIARKKTHGLGGLEAAFSDVGVESTYVNTSLSDGWKREHLPAVANNLREGSYDRGVNTQLGGKGTKDIINLLQNTVISMDDCGDKIGLEVIFTEKEKALYIGNTLLIDGKLVRITDDNFKSFTNKKLKMRDPAFCKAGKANFCKTCMGGKYENHPTGLASGAAAITTKFMLVFMKSAHGRSLTTTTYDFNLELT